MVFGRRILPFLCVIALMPGCLARQVARDGVHMRQALLDMYTDQVMDNLIRAHNNMPFVQVAYADITVQDNDEVRGAANAGGNLTEQVLPVVVRQFERVTGIEGSATRSRTMSFIANPITDQNDIYEAYMEFARDPERFVVSKDDPGCEAHIVRRNKKLYYWVPADAGPAFLDLTLKTTFMRGPETAPPSAYEVTILDAKATPTGIGDFRSAKITFSPDIRNSDATMVVRLASGTHRIHLLQANQRVQDGKNVNIAKGDMTNVLQTKAWSPTAQGYTENDLNGAKARIYSHEYPPDAPAPALAPLQRIRSDVNFLRNLPRRPF